MILYSFTNMYLEGIHAGIQTAHMINEMWVKYTNGNPFYKRRLEILQSWAKTDKVIFIYNGGYQSTLDDRQARFSHLSHALDLPYASFRESPEALNNALTCVGIIAPSTISNHSIFATTDGADLRDLLTNCHRAR